MKKNIIKVLTLFAAIATGSYTPVVKAQITFNVIVDGSPQWPAASYAGVGVAPDLGTNWNALKVGYGTTVPIVTNNIQDSLGVVFPGVSVTFSNHTQGGSQYTWNDNSTSGAVPPNPVDLMRTYTFFATYDIVVSGLAAGKYDLWYAGHGNAANQQGTVTINANNGGGTFKTANSALGRDLVAGGLGVAYTNFTGLTVSNNGVFRFQADYLNMFQLRPSQPEGPAFLVTGGSACSSVAVGVSGSVTTNTYLLYTNGVYTGQSVAGTGAPISFGVQTTRAVYTVVATNTATATSGLMYGIASLYTAGIAITTQPTNITLVTNLPATFAVVAVGDTLSYQWYKNGVVLTNGGDVSGATTATLLINPAQAADAATAANGYSVAIQNPCGEVATSAVPVALTLTAPRNLIWAGGNPDDVWDHSELNFTLSGSPVSFAEGDNVTFNDSSANTSLAISNDVTATLISVAGTGSYAISGPNKITGITKLVDTSSGTLSIYGVNDYAGGTIVSNGATLSLGDGGTAANNGSVAGTVTVSSGGILDYNFGGSGSATINLNHSLAGSGTVNFMTANGSIIATPLNVNSSGFNGTINVAGYTTVHATGVSGGLNVLGLGSIVNVLQDGGQLWIDPPGSGVYSNVFNIQGNGRLTDNPQLGAIRLYNTTLIGSINLLDNTRIGGSIAGGTIRSTISGPYQLEVLGTTIANFVLQMGPTNGTHSYNSTLLTAGTIKALNNNAISTGPLTIDNAGTLLLNGNNLSVSNLASLNTGTVAGPGAQVQNGSTSASSVLTVGMDGTSSEFDGVFGDGSSTSLGLTKVGAGTLTLTGANTNSGPVTVTGGTIALSGSGAFSIAPIVIGNGASFDVSGIGGTLTLNANQYLEGNGMLSGRPGGAGGFNRESGVPDGHAPGVR